jgi:hypothetical protein
MVRPVGVEPTQDAVPETAALSTELRARDDLYYRTYFRDMQMQKLENHKKLFGAEAVTPLLLSLRVCQQYAQRSMSVDWASRHIENQILAGKLHD